jgi:PAS domain S-box-containing protein
MSSAEEVTRLRDCLNDLASITALPALWTDSEPRHIVSTLADALLGTLRLAFVIVRLHDPHGGPSIEVTGVADSWQGAMGASLASARLGLQGEIGIVVAGSQRLEFPAETDRLLLDVAASQATIALQQAHVVAERRRAQDAVRDSERESRLIVDSIPGLVALLSANGALEVANRQILDYTGRTLEELQQWGTSDVVHSEDLPQVIDVFGRSIVAGSPYDIVMRVRRADGVYRWFQNSGFPLRDAIGQVVRWCVLLTDIDDAKRAGDAIRESERQFRLFVEKIPALVWRGTPEGELDYLNQKAVEYLGHTAQSLSGGRWLELVHPDHRDATVRRWLHSATTGSSYDDVYQLRRADGQYRWIQSVGEPFHDTDGRIAHWYGLVTDIDDARRAGDAIRESERNLKLIIDTIPALAWSARPDGSAEFFSQHYLDFIGFAADRAGDWGWTAAVHPEDLNSLAAAWQRIMASAAPGEAEARLRRYDGEYRWFLFRANPLRDEQGHIARWYGVNTDIEDRKQAEAELRRAHDSFADAQRLSKTGSFITDLVGDDHNWSEEAYRIFEFDPGTKVTVQRVRDVIHPDDLPSFEDVIARGMTGANVTFGFRIVTAQGAMKHVRGVAHVIEQIRGRPMFIGALQDVTEAIVAQEALNRAGAELAHVSRVTTLSALTASIAHEVNQPLAGIITNAGTCLRMLDAAPPDIEGARETARRTIRDGNRASDVITRLRALFSKREFALEPLDLNEAAREVIALSSNDVQRNRIVLQSELADDLPIVTGDRIQLQQVILNLLRNAADAMADVHDRPRQLLIKTDREDSEHVRVTVRDVGVGLPPQSVDSLFDAFYTTKSGGMGIGLFVSRSIVEKHHGRLWAEPNDGPGATFSFSIPRGPIGVDDAPGRLRTVS